MDKFSNSETIQPILVMLVWRGNERFQRALDSLFASEHFFKRIILSITSSADSEDVRIAERYVEVRRASENPSKAEIICSGTELPTMQHQAFWIQYLLSTGANERDWIYWLAYDDQLLPEGISRVVDQHMNWPLQRGHCYFGPWAIRHETPDLLWSGDESASLEVWTSFPSEGPIELNTLRWITDQILQPTYMQMSGSVCTLESHNRLVSRWPKKSGPMRIEMATALSTDTHTVEEFTAPTSIIYGRSNSDRSNYSEDSRIQDRHFLKVLFLWMLRHPKAWIRIPGLVIDAAGYAKNVASRQLPSEEWRVRGRFEWNE